MIEPAAVFLLVGAITLPTTERVADYPSWALRESRSAAAIIDYWVDKDGKAYNCKLIARIGDEKLANEMCRIIQHARYKAALDEAGSPVTAHIVDLIRMVVPDSDQADEIMAARMQPDAVFKVNKMPEGVGEAYSTKVGLTIDQSGKITNCSPMPAKNSTLDNLACDQIASENFPVGLDRDDRPVNYVRSLKVEFELATS